MKTLMAALVVFCAAPARAQTVWLDQQSVVEVLRSVEPLRLELQRDEAKLGEGAGAAAFLEGSLVRVKGSGAGQGAWRYSVTYDAFQPVNDVYYLTLAEAQGLIRPDRNAYILDESQERQMSELERLASRLAFLDSARTQLEERTRGRELDEDYDDDDAVDDMRLAAAFKRLSYEWDRAMLDCRRLRRTAGLAGMLVCPKGGLASR